MQLSQLVFWYHYIVNFDAWEVISTSSSNRKIDEALFICKQKPVILPEQNQLYNDQLTNCSPYGQTTSFMNLPGNYDALKVLQSETNEVVEQVEDEVVNVGQMCVTLWITKDSWFGTLTTAPKSHGEIPNCSITWNMFIVQLAILI